MTDKNKIELIHAYTNLIHTFSQVSSGSLGGWEVSRTVEDTIKHLSREIQKIKVEDKHD